MVKKLIHFFLYFYIILVFNFNLNSQIKILKPSSNEIYNNKKPITIEWNGTKVDDLVSIEYSIDNGENWILITDSATNYKYIWTNKPFIDSENCLIKLKNNNLESIYNKPPVLDWQATYGGSADDYIGNIQIIDNNLYLMGSTWSNDEDMIKTNYSISNYILKLNTMGEILQTYLYQRSIGSSYQNLFKFNDTVIYGFGSIDFLSASPNYKASDFHFFKINKDNNIIDNKVYGGSGNERLYSMVLDKDSNFVLFGDTHSNDFDVDCKKSNISKAWLIKLNQKGEILKKFCVGGSNYDRGFKIINTNDNGFLLLLNTSSPDYEFAKMYGLEDASIIKLDSNLNVEWGNTFGGNKTDVIYKVINSKDNHYYLIGNTNSFSNDVVDTKGEIDAWIVKVDNNGNLIWSKNYGGFNDDFFTDIIEIDNNQFLISSTSYSPNGNMFVKYGDCDSFLSKIDNNGNIIWQSTYGGRNLDIARLMNLNKDELFLINNTNSNNGTLLEKNLNRKPYDLGYDLWLLKLKFEGLDLLADTLKQTFTIAPKIIISHNIDFGEEFINENKDSLVINFIFNDGNYNNKIDSLFIINGDISSFSVVNFNNQVLNSKNGLDVQFRFTPQKVGLNSALIAIISENDTIIQNITGVGKEREFDIEYLNNNLDFGNLRLGKSKDTIDFEVLKNNGIRKLNITKIDIDGIDVNDFKILNETQNLEINQNESLKLNIIFSPKNIGSKNITLTIFSNNSKLQNIINIKGYAYSLNIADNINFGQEYLNNTKDTIVSRYINNVESFDFNIDNIYILDSINSFSVINFKNQVLNSKNGVDVQFRFTPIKIGEHTANIFIISEKDTIIKQISGIGKEREFEIQYLNNNLDFGNLKLGESKDTINFEVLKNNGIRKLIISNIEINGIDKNDFKILNKTNFELNKNEILNLDIEFKPTATGNKNAEIVIQSNNSELNNVVNLSGYSFEIQKAKFDLIVDSFEAYAGETIEIPIKMQNDINLIESNLNSFNFTLKYNPSILVPLSNNFQKLNEKTAIINIKDIRIDNIINNKNNENYVVIGNIKFLATLGNAENCNIEISDIELEGGKADVITNNGKFKLLGICYEGGVRLIGVTDDVYLSNILPNPVIDNFTIDVNLIEKGKTEIYICNLFGENIKTIFSDEVLNTGKLSFNNDVSNLPSGQYYLILKTPTFYITKEIIISR